MSETLRLTLVHRNYHLMQLMKLVKPLSYLVSMVHASAVSWLILELAINLGISDTFSCVGAIETCPAYRYAEAMKDIMLITMGYLSVDIMVVIMLMATEGTSKHILTLIHHLIGVIGFIAIITTHLGYSLGIFGIFTEASTIFLNICWFCRTYGYQNTFVYDASAAMTITLFLLVRVVGGISMGILIWKEGHVLSPIYYNLACFFGGSLTLMNIYWFSKLVSAVTNHKKPEEIKDKEV